MTGTGPIGLDTVRGIRADALDCMQANLAVLADHHHGPAAHLELGAELVFRPDPAGDDDALPTVEPSLDDHLDRARRLLGLVPQERAEGIAGAELAERAHRHGTAVYAVADAYHLPWVPYFGRRHMEHSMLVAPDPAGDGVVVSDAYRNVTQWGAAESGQWTLGRAEFAAALPDGARTAVLTAEGALPSARPAVTHADATVRDRYLARYAGHRDRATALSRLCLETWLLTRARALHLHYRRAAGLATHPGAEQHVRDWQLLAEQVFVAHRRVERGRAEPRAVLDRLEALLVADLDVFPATTPVPPATTAGGGGAALRERVAAAAAGVLGTTPALLMGGAPLSETPGFTSFRVVEIVELLEHDLHFEFDPADLMPETLHNLDALTAAVHRGITKEAAA
ncbi:hypothetical protein ACWD4B_12890 [Streptomyces sp. NPDC002536]